jgi:hypothetical protein
VTVLRAKYEFKFICINQSLYTSQICERWMYRHIDRREVIFGQKIRKFLHALDRFKMIVVHFPIAADYRLASLI